MALGYYDRLCLMALAFRDRPYTYQEVILDNTASVETDKKKMPNAMHVHVHVKIWMLVCSVNIASCLHARASAHT